MTIDQDTTPTEVSTPPAAASATTAPVTAMKPPKKTKAAATKSKAKPKAKPKKASKRKQAKVKVKLRPDGLRSGSAGGVLVDTICRKAGATHAELCAIIGWKQCLPFVMKSCQQAGVKLRKEREDGGVVRYYGTSKSR